MNERIAKLLERLMDDLHEALPPDLATKLVLYVAASELICEDLQPEDRGALRFATMHLAFQALGVTDSGIERAKIQLESGRDLDSLNRRH